MGRRKHDTSKYGVSMSRSLGVQIFGGFVVVMVVVVGLMAVHSISG